MIRSARSASTVQVLRWLAGAMVAAACGTAAASALRPLLATAPTALGMQGLTAWVLFAVAAAALLTSLYLVAVWTLAVLVILLPEASPFARSAAHALRLIAPSMARRLGVGVLTASTAFLTPGGLVAAPGPTPTASSGHVARPSDDSRAAAGTRVPALTGMLGSRPAHNTSSVPHPAPRPSLLPGHTATPLRAAARFETSWAVQPAHPPQTPEDPQAEHRQEDRVAEARPPLAWGGPQRRTPPQGFAQDAAQSTTDVPAADSSPQSLAPRPEGPGDEDPAPVRTITVAPGDSLWSISDDLLGPGPDEDAEIARTWPRLHTANRAVIGPDPDHIEPGQELVVPLPLTSPRPQSSKEETP